MATHFATVDDYIKSFPKEVRPILEKIRATIRNTAPAAAETISYNIAAMTLDGRYLVYFAGWKNHISIYPAPAGDESYERRIAAYRASKGTLKFPLSRPIPYDLIEQVVQLLVETRVDHGDQGQPPAGE